LKLFREGKLRKAREELEAPIVKYKETVLKFREAANKNAATEIFNSFRMVIDTFIKRAPMRPSRNRSTRQK
jgi:hypothetical protein